MLESLRGERETLLTNPTDFIQKLALNSPATLNALGGKGIDSILNGSEITPEMYTIIGDAVKTTVKPTAGELDQEEISRVSDLLVDPEGTQGKPRNGIDSFVSQGYYNQVKAQSNISPSEFDKRFEYLLESGKATGSTKVTPDDYSAVESSFNNPKVQKENGYIKHMQDYVNLRDYWIRAEYDVKDFDSQFSRYLYRGPGADKANFEKYGLEHLLIEEEEKTLDTKQEVIDWAQKQYDEGFSKAQIKESLAKDHPQDSIDAAMRSLRKN